MWSRNKKISELLKEMVNTSNEIAKDDLNFIQQCYTTREDNILHLRIYLMQINEYSAISASSSNMNININNPLNSNLTSTTTPSSSSWQTQQEIRTILNTISQLERYRIEHENAIISKYAPVPTLSTTQSTTSIPTSSSNPPNARPLHGRASVATTNFQSTSLISHNQQSSVTSQPTNACLKQFGFKIFSKIHKLNLAYLAKIQMYFPRLYEIICQDQVAQNSQMRESSSALLSQLTVSKIFAHISKLGRQRLARETSKLNTYLTSYPGLNLERNKTNKNDRFYTDKHLQGPDSFTYVISLQKKFYLRPTNTHKTLLQSKKSLLISAPTSTTNFSSNSTFEDLLNIEKSSKQIQNEPSNLANQANSNNPITSAYNIMNTNNLSTLSNVPINSNNSIMYNNNNNNNNNNNSEQLTGMMLMLNSNGQAPNVNNAFSFGSGKEHESIVEVILSNYEKHTKEWMSVNKHISYRIKLYSQHSARVSAVHSKKHPLFSQSATSLLHHVTPRTSFTTITRPLAISTMHIMHMPSAPHTSIVQSSHLLQLTEREHRNKEGIAQETSEQQIEQSNSQAQTEQKSSSVSEEKGNNRLAFKTPILSSTSITDSHTNLTSPNAKAAAAEPNNPQNMNNFNQLPSPSQANSQSKFAIAGLSSLNQSRSPVASSQSQFDFREFVDRTSITSNQQFELQQSHHGTTTTTTTSTGNRQKLHQSPTVGSIPTTQHQIQSQQQQQTQQLMAIPSEEEIRNNNKLSLSPRPLEDILNVQPLHTRSVQLISQSSQQIQRNANQLQQPHANNNQSNEIQTTSKRLSLQDHYSIDPSKLLTSSVNASVPNSQNIIHSMTLLDSTTKQVNQEILVASHSLSHMQQQQQQQQQSSKVKETFKYSKLHKHRRVMKESNSIANSNTNNSKQISHNNMNDSLTSGLLDPDTQILSEQVNSLLQTNPQLCFLPLPTSSTQVNSQNSQGKIGLVAFNQFDPKPVQSQKQPIQSQQQQQLQTAVLPLHSLKKGSKNFDELYQISRMISPLKNSVAATQNSGILQSMSSPKMQLQQQAFVNNSNIASFGNGSKKLIDSMAQRNHAAIAFFPQQTPAQQQNMIYGNISVNQYSNVPKNVVNSNPLHHYNFQTQQHHNSQLRFPPNPATNTQQIQSQKRNFNSHSIALVGTNFFSSPTAAAASGPISAATIAAALEHNSNLNQLLHQNEVQNNNNEQNMLRSQNQNLQSNPRFSRSNQLLMQSQQFTNMVQSNIISSVATQQQQQQLTQLPNVNQKLESANSIPMVTKQQRNLGMRQSQILISNNNHHNNASVMKTTMDILRDSIEIGSLPSLYTEQSQMDAIPPPISIAQAAMHSFETIESRKRGEQRQSKSNKSYYYRKQQQQSKSPPNRENMHQADNQSFSKRVLLEQYQGGSFRQISCNEEVTGSSIGAAGANINSNQFISNGGREVDATAALTSSASRKSYMISPMKKATMARPEREKSTSISTS